MSTDAVQPRLRLGFLDGIRGLAAMYVLLFHSLTISVPQDDQQLSAPMRFLRGVFSEGHYAVCVFIVLSGFSLMLPLARGDSLHLQGGMRHYLRRRVRRLFPPYYAALVVSLVAVLAATRLSSMNNSDESYEAALRPGSILSHAFLIHNWNFDWAYRINGPMWSVATEWQIYFLFPLLLLPLWRRIGGVTTILAIWAVTIGINVAWPYDQAMAWAAPWFIGSFALGMWGARHAFSPTRRADDIPWGWITMLLLGIVVLLSAVEDGWPLSIIDGVVSLMALTWILACVRGLARSTSTASAINRVLGSRPLIILGAFSYSLYLLQHPLLRFTEQVLGELALSYEQVLWIQLLVGTPLIMAVAWIFAEFFELPFTTGGTLVPFLRRRARFDRRLATVEPSGSDLTRPAAVEPSVPT